MKPKPRNDLTNAGVARKRHDRRSRLELNLDVGDAGRMNAVATSPQLTWIVDFSPLPKSHDPASARIAGDKRAMAAKAGSGCDRFDHGLGRSARHVRAERQIELEVTGVRQSALQMRGEAVARHDVEADAGQERHASRLGFGVPRGEGLEDVDFPGDVEVVDAIAETGVGHRSRRRRKRTGDAEHDRNVLSAGVNAGRVGKIERPGGEPERLSDAL